MRDINQYSKQYAQAVFEEYQVKFRREKILEILKQYSPARILEIGCGMEPLFSYINWPFENYTVVEPSVTFIENAKNLAKNQNIYFINDGFAATEDIKESGFNFIVC